MLFELFINFDGNCREAVEYYAKVFDSDVNNLMTYGQAPPDPNYTTPESDKERISYADMLTAGSIMRFMDIPSGSQLTYGNNINATIRTDDEDEVRRLFNVLKEGGEVHMELHKTFFSDLYGMVTDKFGVSWRLLYDTLQE